MLDGVSERVFLANSRRIRWMPIACPYRHRVFLGVLVPVGVGPPPLNWSTSYDKETEDQRWQSSVTSRKKSSPIYAR